MSQTALQKIAANPELGRIQPLVVKQGWVLKKLSQKHKTIIALHVQCVDRIDIASIAGCTPEYVSMIVKQPLAQQYIAELESYMDERARANSMKAIQVVAEKLDSDDEDIQLKAARLALEQQGKLKPSGDKGKSAEDVVAAILAQAGTVVIGHNVQVNQSGD